MQKITKMALAGTLLFAGLAKAQRITVYEVRDKDARMMAAERSMVDTMEKLKVSHEASPSSPETQQLTTQYCQNMQAAKVASDDYTTTLHFFHIAPDEAPVWYTFQNANAVGTNYAFDQHLGQLVEDLKAVGVTCPEMWSPVKVYIPQAPLVESGQPTQVDSLGNSKPFTFDDYDRALDRAIGLFKMAIATETKVQVWYQVNAESDEAQRLQVDDCGNRKRVMDAAKAVLSMMRDSRFHGVMAAANSEDVKRANAKADELVELTAQRKSLLRQLGAMGMACPAG